VPSKDKKQSYPVVRIVAKNRPNLSWAFARLLSVTADDLDPISGHSVVSVIHLERDVLDQECPDLVTEPICVEAALQVGKKSHLAN
jgi:hypothetical protein